jgi:tRNA nucleotidyltransferase (CCA-adding enzyme)
MTTDARPEEIMAAFPKTYPTGLKHGTVTVALEGGSIEVTTFRAEGTYSDGRHPDGVTFVSTLEEDLARRDFTMNAMAMGEDGILTDPFGGQRDLSARLIRCVGMGEQRFREDGLRMFRGLRFAAQLGFELEGDTAAALCACGSRASSVSSERVRVEVEKLLCAPEPQRGEMLFSLGLMDRWLARTPVSLAALTRLEPVPLERWAGLFALLDQPPEGLLRGLRVEKKLREAICGGWTLWTAGLPREGYGWRKALSEFGPEACRAAASMGTVWTGGPHREALIEVLESGACWSVGRLALSGGGLRELGYAGPEIGRMQARLLEEVLRCPGKNTEEQLRRMAVEWREAERGR